MRSLISWTVRNMPAMNTLVVAILIVGAMSFAGMRREVFPEFELEIILVNVPYPGATPEEVEAWQNGGDYFMTGKFDPMKLFVVVPAVVQIVVFFMMLSVMAFNELIF